MRASERAGVRADSWAAAGASGAWARRPKRARRGAQGSKTTHAAVVFSLFLVLLAAALLIGGHAVIDPMLQTAADERGAKRVGEIVYAMPDGTFCRHLLFDNTTGELIERSVQQCAHDHLQDRVPDRVRAAIGFAWGGR